MFFVNERWLGGMLTNFKTIQSRIAQLKKIEAMEADGTFDVLPKKEVINLKKQQEKLEKNLGGIKEMQDIPTSLFRHFMAKSCLKTVIPRLNPCSELYGLTVDLNICLPSFISMITALFTASCVEFNVVAPVMAG